MSVIRYSCGHLATISQDGLALEAKLLNQCQECRERSGSWILILGFTLLFILLLQALPLHSQELGQVNVICVTWPRSNNLEARLERDKIGQELRSLGRTVVNCWDNPQIPYDAELWLYPYAGAVQGQTYFAAQFGTAPGVVVGSFTLSQSVVGFSGWMISLWPKGKYLSIYRDSQARTLEGGLKKMVKALDKARRNRQ